MKSYRELSVWQKSMELVEETYRLTKLLPADERYSLCDQIRRAAVSIPSNIAEGNGRSGSREYIRFLNIARGSKYELETQFLICVKIGYLSSQQIQRAMDLCNEIGKMLNSLISKLSASQSPIPNPQSLIPSS